MRITQGYVSKSISDFPFHQIYSLDDYNTVETACVFFGMYRYEDKRILFQHQGPRVVFWTGQDVIDFRDDLPQSLHVTAHPKVYERLQKKFRNVKLIPPSTFLNTANPQKLGKLIYAYCPNSAPDYHGKKVLDELRAGGYEITIGDGTWTQDQWRNGKADFFYNGVLIGLCLSDFAGGGTSIIEMGLRGIKVVTNVFDLPNCIKWADAADVARTIEAQQGRIGFMDNYLADDVWKSLDHEYTWLEYDG